MVLTLDETKTFLGITTTDHDAALTAILPAVDVKVKEITRRQWNDEQDPFPLENKPIAAKLAWWMVQQEGTRAPATGVQSKSLGDVSVTYADADLDGVHGVPSWAIKGLPRYGRGY